MVYLVDNPPRIRQYRSPRRAKPSGVVVVHTAESFPDETGPDTGAENVAAFIRDRTNHGSYHDLADSDSIIQLVRYGDEAFHDGTGSNPHSYGVSAATQAHRWGGLDDFWVKACVTNMARATARYATWVKAAHGVTIPARRISRAQSEDRAPGFISHAERDPDRRTDPGASFPWEMYLDTYARLMAGEEDDMPYSDWPEADKEALATRVAQRVHTRSVQVGLDTEALEDAVGRDRAAGRRIEAKLDVVLEAVADIDGIDGDALAAKVAAAVERLDAEAVASELEVTVRE